MAIDSRYKLKTGEEVEPFPPIQNTDTPYASEAAMHADQANQLEGYGYLVDGVGAFTYLGTVAGTAADYEGFVSGDASVSFSTFSESSVGTMSIAGAYPGNVTEYVNIIPNNGTNSYLILNGGTTTTSAFSKLGYTSINRIINKTWVDNIRETSQSTGTPPEIKLYILGRNNSGTADTFSDAGLGFLSIGASKKSVHNAIATLF